MDKYPIIIAYLISCGFRVDLDNPKLIVNRDEKGKLYNVDVYMYDPSLIRRKISIMRSYINGMTGFTSYISSESNKDEILWNPFFIPDHMLLIFMTTVESYPFIEYSTNTFCKIEKGLH